MKKRKDACTKDATQKSAIPDHARKENHPIEWKEGPIVDQVRKIIELALYEALQIQQTPDGQIGIELRNCLVSALRILFRFHTMVEVLGIHPIEFPSPKLLL